ncbi:subtilisin-like protease SBT5.4 [Pistacia vera]|uniref:subtilisin-like protease SBT5.4 n=1 Tax=Pistacia vera TaxID=55513 RepID=UPI0012631B8D|nr:subtilisin-like protease SBT5.4 [Pistacia vera]
MITGLETKSSLFYSYNRFINGFACVLHDDDVPKVQKHPKVISVFLNHGRKLQTTHSWNFLGLEKDYDNIPSNSIWKKTNFGDDVIIGNIDSGVWPESKSFADEGIGPVPKRWQGTCNSKDEVKCNRKLIGVRYFNKGYLKYARRVARRHNSTYTVTPKMMTSRDFNGHGTHTLSTAGGNLVPNVNVFGNGNGTAKGGSPRARVASYKVCWEPIDNRQCFDADIMAAIEAAISDGVDVLSISIGGGPEEYFNDGVAIGSFHAVKQGISVVVSGGNQGPMPGSVGNIAPWLFTIGASTTDREFVNYVTLGNKKIFKGVSLSDKGLKSEKFYPMITGEDARANETPVKNASACQPGTLDPEKVKGKILVCLWLGSKQLETGKYADKLEAVGMILANHKKLPNVAFTNMHVLPTSHINSKDGEAIFDYIHSTKDPVAHISNVKTEIDTKAAPAIAEFSARGPNMIDPTILKPDVIAPGVNIIAANSEATSPTNLNSDNRRIPYITMSGTSMACPHVSGIVGLIKAVHRDWSPAAIRSAIMTTSRKTDANSNPIVYENDNSAANPFAYGAGLPNPNSALDPGLVYDLNAESYLNYLCAHGYNQSLIRAFTISEKPYSCPESFNVMNLNYPSIVLPYLNGSIELTRSLKNVGSPGTYNVTVNAPSGVSIVVEPSSLNFEKYGQEKKFVIRFSPRGSEKGYRFGEMIWSDGMHNVRSPILVKNGKLEM